MWKFDFNQVPNLSKKIKNIWQQFIQQLSGQNITIIIDFTYQYEFWYQISNKKEYICKRNGELRQYYQKQNEKYGHERYKLINNCLRTEWIGIIGEIKKNGELIVNSIIRDIRSVRAEDPPLFNQFITQMIIESKAMAASDASVKNGEMGGTWIIKN